MDTVFLVILIVVGVLLLAALLGALITTRRNRAGAGSFSESLRAMDRQLAAAVAADHGWERKHLDTAARTEFAAQRAGVAIESLDLLQIVDEPGTDSDLAVYRVATAAGSVRLTLGRGDGVWYAKALEDER
jgi:type II secretory pathway pseudopilin PulG